MVINIFQRKTQNFICVYFRLMNKFFLNEWLGHKILCAKFQLDRIPEVGHLKIKIHDRTKDKTMNLIYRI